MSVGCRLSAADWWDFHASHASPGERTSWGAGRWERSLWQFGRRQLGGTEGCMEDGRCSWWAVSGRMQRTSVSSSAEWGWGRPSCFTGAVDHAWHSASSWETPAVRPRHADGLSLAAEAALTPHAHPLPPPHVPPGDTHCTRLQGEPGAWAIASTRSLVGWTPSPSHLPTPPGPGAVLGGGTVW